MYARKGNHGFRTPFKVPRITSTGSQTGNEKDSEPNSSPLLPQKRTYSPSSSQTKISVSNNESEIKSGKYNILWRKKSTKKNKTWDGDGYMILEADSKSALVKNEDGITLGKLKKLGPFIFESTFSVGGYEIEVDGECHNNVPEATLSPKNQNSLVTSNLASAPYRIPSIRGVKRVRKVENNEKAIVPPGFSSGSRVKPKGKEPLYDITSEDALLMLIPTSLAEDEVIDVVVDPLLSNILRPHQREGIQFLYECVMGFRNFRGNGCLLADEMGLGKTLMTISLIWTLLRQNPHMNSSPVLKKVLICCPVTLIGNWKKEFHKWLGMNRVGVLAINGSQNSAKEKESILRFGKTRVYQVLIIGYEKLLTVKKELVDTKFDLVVCDEGHRLKNSSNKIFKTIETLDIKRRIVLTGTPIQNDLTEFFNIIKFLNPEVLGDLKSFQREYMKPILQSREPSCFQPEIKKAGDDKSKELINLTKLFILRRTNSVMKLLLPPRTDLILSCPATPLQLHLFKLMQQTALFNKIIRDNRINDSLGLMTTFRKICNSPSLLTNDGLFAELCSGEDKEKLRSELANKFTSGKIKVLLQLLKEIYKKGDEKVVLVSNFTQTLDVIQNILEGANIPFGRLDGSTNSKIRTDLVNKFNRSRSDEQFVFLLSAKSGGCGLNLIGASRLILFDNDWNPSVDIQAMARIHRDGQTRPTFIYRLLTTGCIDEKIFQRQLLKTNLSDRFLDEQANSENDFFYHSDIKDLFTLHEETSSNTHDLMECSCKGDGFELTIDSCEQETDDEIEENVSETIDNNDLSESLKDTTNTQHAWVSALDVQHATQEPEKQKSSIKNCLINYKHFDPENINPGNSELIDNIDPILSSLLVKQAESKKNYISYLFVKSGIQ
ncbi:ATPase activity protein [[Candida] boidinii]|nr:ATPase activity protein [[Candida] boidinii]